LIRNKLIRCFVAMALGHPDTNLLYEKNIEPAIREGGLVSVRVDRVVHMVSTNDLNNNLDIILPVIEGLN
jgi:hypothetical protein